MAETKKKGRIRRYFRELISEFKKLEWPTKSKVLNNTIVVLVMMLFVTAFVWVLDLGFSKFLEFILGLAK
ncbi:MAG: preprotein translocase subunit SecE [Clostridia bacterium]|nr:preprotein translocase subunit SecE [Clostridia bacterium]MBR5769009.1 preprotein translocase subunit SecE [Clostridia bacterium]MBR5941910.1 preprotein translocase subunit SecE [Clostridia bacterium]